MHTDLVTFVFMCVSVLFFFSLCVIEGGMHMVFPDRQKKKKMPVRFFP